MRRATTTRGLTILATPILAAGILLTTGCATSFSPAAVRTEIVRQTGQQPERVFELTLGRLTTRLAVGAIGSVSDGALPLAGLSGFELALYDTQGRPAPDQPALDFTLMPVRGWEPVVRTRNEERSAVVLIQAGGDLIRDLVLLAADGDRALYARLRGRLSPSLPEALGEAVRREGTEGVRQELLSLTGSNDR